MKYTAYQIKKAKRLIFAFLKVRLSVDYSSNSLTTLSPEFVAAAAVGAAANNL
jgi:hypothetical protein